MRKAVGELLNYSQGLHWDYLGPNGQRLSVYLAYWSADKMSSRLVAGHTPDVCWVAGGWKRRHQPVLSGSCWRWDSNPKNSSSRI